MNRPGQRRSVTPGGLSCWGSGGAERAFSVFRNRRLSSRSGGPDRSLLALGGLVALVLVGGRAAEPAYALAPSPGCGHTSPGQSYNATVPVDGTQRTALVVVPPQAKPGVPLPLLVMFHGAHSSGPATASSTGLAQAASAAGFISVYPDANGSYWARPEADDRNQNDMVFVGRLMAQLDSALCVDDSRVYGAGGSNGAGFLTRVACSLGARFTAIAPVAGVYRPLAGCRPPHPISVLEIHGTNDHTAPYDSLNPMDPMGKIGVYSLLDAWFIWDQCPPGAPTWRRLGPRALWLAKSGCAGGTTVAHIKLIGEPHAWPTASTSSHAIGVAFDASQAIMQFFQTGTVSFPQTVSPGHTHRGPSPRSPHNESGGGRAAPAATSRTG